MEKIEPRIISFAGIDAADTFLNLHPALTDRQEREIIAHLRSVARGMPWWVGDFALHYQRKLDAAAKAEAAQAKEEKRPAKVRANYDDILAEAWGIAANTIRHAAAVAGFFAVGARHPKLTFRHHLDAIRAVGGTSGSVDAARGWLKKAEEGGWSCADLRENAQPPPSLAPPSSPEDNPFTDLDSADKWATQHRAEVQQLTPARAATLLTRLQSLVELVDHLRFITGANVVDSLRGTAGLRSNERAS